jgi:hypothetical protein
MLLSRSPESKEPVGQSLIIAALLQWLEHILLSAANANNFTLLT